MRIRKHVAYGTMCTWMLMTAGTRLMGLSQMPLPHVLLAHDRPGNVREPEHAMARAAPSEPRPQPAQAPKRATVISQVA